MIGETVERDERMFRVLINSRPMRGDLNLTVNIFSLRLAVILPKPRKYLIGLIVLKTSLQNIALDRLFGTEIGSGFFPHIYCCFYCHIFRPRICASTFTSFICVFTHLDLLMNVNRAVWYCGKTKHSHAKLFLPKRACKTETKKKKCGENIRWAFLKLTPL